MADPPIDRSVLRELQDTAGADFVGELIDTFLDEAPHMLAELRDAQAAGAADRFRRAAHSLKSNGQTFGALPLAAMARTLELGGLGGDAAPLDALQAEFVRAAAALRALRDG